MKRICAWCDNEIGEKPGEGETHGICGPCAKREEASWIRDEKRSAAPASDGGRRDEHSQAQHDGALDVAQDAAPIPPPTGPQGGPASAAAQVPQGPAHAQRGNPTGSAGAAGGDPGLETEVAIEVHEEATTSPGPEAGTSAAKALTSGSAAAGSGTALPAKTIEHLRDLRGLARGAILGWLAGTKVSPTLVLATGRPSNARRPVVMEGRRPGVHLEAIRPVRAIELLSWQSHGAGPTVLVDAYEVARYIDEVLVDYEVEGPWATGGFMRKMADQAVHQ